MRYVVLGAGAVGGVIAGRLCQHGVEVRLVARGPHLDAIRSTGLRLSDPSGTVEMAMTAVEHPGQLDWRGDEVVVLATKTPQTAAVLDALAGAAPASVGVVCAQNGVENERLALRRFPNVYGMCVMLPASHLDPGSVRAHSAPTTGVLDVGRYPEGVDAVASAVAGDLEGSTFSALAQERIMRWKHAKLLMNLGNSIEAACGRRARTSGLYARARAEGESVLVAAGIDFASEDEDRKRRADHITMRPVEGAERGGGSTWQSLARSTGSVESDFLNGEIVLLGRLHGVPTPVNEMLAATVRRMALAGSAPGSLDLGALEALLGATTSQWADPRGPIRGRSATGEVRDGLS